MSYGFKMFLAGVFVGFFANMILGYCLLKYDEYKERKVKQNVIGTSKEKQDSLQHKEKHTTN